MTNNSEISIDNLIKRIYKSYVEIKVGEFREIDRDMLLSDIGLLYTNIKKLYPSTETPIIEFELDQKNSVVNETIQDRNATSKNEEEKKDIITSKNVENENITNEEIYGTSPIFDLSMFEDADHLELEPTQKQNLIDKKSDNTSSPILKEFLSKAEEKPTIQDFKSIPKMEENRVKLEEIIPETKKEESKVENLNKASEVEPDKKNTNNIMDFLHHEEIKQTKDIYSFLDINTRIGLIELFFKGNSLELTECLVKLNKLSDKEECVKVIDKFAETFGVDKKEEIYKQFVNLVDRKLNI